MVVSACRVTNEVVGIAAHVTSRGLRAPERLLEPRHRAQRETEPTGEEPSCVGPDPERPPSVARLIDG
jgi:hypothetical protein